jgi:hypothetical protein
MKALQNIFPNQLNLPLTKTFTTIFRDRKSPRRPFDQQHEKNKVNLLAHVIGHISPGFYGKLQLLQFQRRIVKSEFHRQGDAKWIVIRRSLWDHNDTPCGRPAPSQLIGRPGSGRPQGVIGFF